MTQPVNDEQRYGDEQLAEPDALFDPEVHDPISFDEIAAYKAFLIGLPQSCTDVPLSRDRMMTCFRTYRGMSISMWEASAIYAATSGTEAVVPIERTVTLMRDAFRTIWGYIESDATNEPSHAQDPYKACKSIVGALEAAEARKAPHRAWVEK